MDWKLDEYADICLRQYCEFQYTSLMYDFVSLTHTGGPRYVTRTKHDYTGLLSTGTSTTKVTAISVSTRTYTVELDPFGAVSTLQAPCCGTCYLSAETIQLIWWPPVTDQLTATPTVTGIPPNATVAITDLPVVGDGSYVDEAGFTFISPSVYIAFTSLGGHNSCGNLGEPIYNTTIGFNPEEISSLLSPVPVSTCDLTHHQVAVFYTLTYTSTWRTVGTVYNTLTRKVEYSDIAQDCSTIPGYSYFPDNPQNWIRELGDPCHPVIIIPDGIKRLRPEWISCGAKGQRGGFYDPPKTLHQGFHLVPTTASPGPGTPTLPPETSNPVNDPPTGTPDQPQLPSTSSDPKKEPDPPGTTLVDPPASNPPSEPTPPASPPQQPPDQSSSNGPPNPPSPPKGGSTTTIVIPSPPPVSTNNSPRPPVTPPPMLTVEPPANTGGGVVTLVPTIVPPPQPSNPSNPGSSTTAVIIGTQTLLPGSTITVGGSTSTLPNGQTTVIGGTQVVLDPSGTQVIIGGSSTVQLPPPGQPTAPIVATIGTNVITANAGGTFIVGSQTLAPGGVITVDGTTLSLAADASQLVVDGTTIPLTRAAQATAGPAVLTLGSQTLTADSSGQFVLSNGQTLVPGGSPLTISGTTLSLSPDASTVLINGTPVPLSHVQPLTAAPFVVTVGDKVLTADEHFWFTIGSQTLSFGGPTLTIDGTTYYMTTDSSGSTVLVAGTAGPSVAVSATTTDEGLVTSASAGVEAESTAGAASATTSKKGAGVRIGADLWTVGVVAWVLAVVHGLGFNGLCKEG